MRLGFLQTLVEELEQERAQSREQVCTAGPSPLRRLDTKDLPPLPVTTTHSGQGTAYAFVTLSLLKECGKTLRKTKTLKVKQNDVLTAASSH